MVVVMVVAVAVAAAVATVVITMILLRRRPVPCAASGPDVYLTAVVRNDE